jgi:hypothetical protein
MTLADLIQKGFNLSKAIDSQLWLEGKDSMSPDLEDLISRWMIDLWQDIKKGQQYDTKR